MEKHVEIKFLAKYNGHSVKANQAVDVAVKCPYDQITNYIQLIQFLNADVTILARVPGEKPVKLGSCRVKEIKVDGDGEGIIKFNSMADFVEIDKLNTLIGSENVMLKVSADIEIEED